MITDFDIQIDREIEVTDLKRELELWLELYNPDNFDKIWDRLEQIQRDEREKCDKYKLPYLPEYDFVDGTRKPFDEKIAKTEEEKTEAHENKRKAMIILMLAEKKCPKFFAKEYIEKYLPKYWEPFRGII